MRGFPGCSDSKESACNAGDPGLIPGEGNDYSLQYSCLENSWTEEPGRLQSMGSQRVDMTERLHFHFQLWKLLVSVGIKTS